jgi:hypothetical protein
MKNSFISTKHYLMYAFVVIFVAANSALMACPNCKEGFDAGTEQANAGAAYSLTIGLLLIVRQQMKLHERRAQTQEVQELGTIS